MNGRCFPPASAAQAQPIPLFGATLLPVADGRADRIAARRRFVSMKQSFMRAAQRVNGADGHDLQQRVRHAQDPFELLALQVELLGALVGHDGCTATLRTEMEEQLQLLFPDTDGPSSR